MTKKEKMIINALELAVMLIEDTSSTLIKSDKVDKYKIMESILAYKQLANDIKQGNVVITKIK